MQEPAYYQQEEFQNRLRKLEEIQQLGIDPYPHSFSPNNTAQQLQTEWLEKKSGSSEEAELAKTEKASIAGRLVLFRGMGKNAFAQLQDGTGRIQVMFNKNTTCVEGFQPSGEISSLKFLEKKIDLGDFLGVEGHLFHTHKGELTLFVHKVKILCKSLLPLPDKHSGLVDKGVRYRKRWLDLIANPDVVNTFVLRSRILELTRAYFHRLGFMEVETPVLQNIYGGAAAKPFVTHLHALDQEMFLRISLEIPLKKLIAGGMLKVFEIGKVFRNEGIDRTHNPEFTELEAYAAYWDYNDMMQLVENLFEELALKLFGTTKLTFERETEEITIDLKAPWKRLSMKDSIFTYAKIQVDQMSEKELSEYLIKNTDLDPKALQKASKGSLIAHAFEELVEEHLIQPHHIIDHPIETTPLCKLHRDPKLKKECFVERFETFILGGEFCNSYTELNDPILQRELLVKQAEKRDAGDEEASPLDEEFLESICQGMPPAGGMGMGIDRLVMLLTKAISIRDVLFFPIMRPEE
ncbi:MAG: lysine--tRNA ligase [Candidatus Rhabdochlamydia sp.]